MGTCVGSTRSLSEPWSVFNVLLIVSDWMLQPILKWLGYSRILTHITTLFCKNVYIFQKEANVFYSFPPSPCKVNSHTQITFTRGRRGRERVKQDITFVIDLVHDDVTRPEGSIGVIGTLKSKMATSGASSGKNSKIIVLFDLSESSNKSPELPFDGAATSEHMSALLPFTSGVRLNCNRTTCLKICKTVLVKWTEWTTLSKIVCIVWNTRKFRGTYGKSRYQRTTRNVLMYNFVVLPCFSRYGQQKLQSYRLHRKGKQCR